MKKFLFLAALASVALAGCVSDESPTIDATPGDKPIAFNSPVLYGHTRAIFQHGEMPATYPTGESFNVYAVWSQDDFAGWEATGAQWYMGNTGTNKEGIKVSYNSSIDDATTGSGAWEPATAYYWPKNGKLTFAAYSPSDAVADFSYGKDGLTIENFEIPGTAAEQYDLMFSKRTYNKTTSTDGTNTTYDGVDIQFQHALSSIRFMVKLKDDYTGTMIKVKKISVYNVEQKGKFEENINESTPGTYTPNPQWTITTDKVLAANAYIPFTGSQTVTTTATLLTDANDLILMPQVFHDGTTEQNDQVNVKVEYTIQSASSSEIAQTHEQKLSAIKTEAGNISSWKIGKRYTYTIVFGLDKIYFAPSVEDWENVTPDPGDINI
ncbi:MAG: fimbrillin family protein [Bacteroides sp.]